MCCTTLPSFLCCSGDLILNPYWCFEETVDNDQVSVRSPKGPKYDRNNSQVSVLLIFSPWRTFESKHKVYYCGLGDTITKFFFQTRLQEML